MPPAAIWLKIFSSFAAANDLTNDLPGSGNFETLRRASMCFQFLFHFSLTGSGI
jgi:hypothetical protein